MHGSLKKELSTKEAQCSQRFVMHCQQSLICLGAGQGRGVYNPKRRSFKICLINIVYSTRLQGAYERCQIDGRLESIMLLMLLTIAPVFLKSFSQKFFSTWEDKCWLEIRPKWKYSDSESHSNVILRAKNRVEMLILQFSKKHALMLF